MKISNIFISALLVIVLAFQIAPTNAFAATRCDWAQFIADVTVPDGTAFKAGDSFNKTWRLKNIGTCTWGTDYSLAFVSGELLGAPASVKLSKSVAPGQTVDITITMTAPSTQGTYRGYWQLKNAGGGLFGIGLNADKSFWVEIKVSSGGTSTGYDFIASAASAQWASAAGNLTFPGADGDAKGFVRKLDNPKLENGVTDSNPGLLMVPQNVTNGFIQGMYPAYKVQAGDKFQTIVNCEYGATACYVNFSLQYQIGSGAPETLWSFNERYEGLYYRASVDLSALAGKDVKFILRINALGSAAGDRALWGNPRIVNSGGVVITPTPITPTKTPGPVTITPTPNTGCDRATFIADVNVPDGTKFAPNTTFTKTWRIKNSGSCTWTTSYNLVFQSGEKMSGPDGVVFPKNVAPGQSVDLSVTLTSPAGNGSYRGYWILKNASGQIFGIGTGANKPFWVDIRVEGGTGPTHTPTKTPPPITVTPVPGGFYDFAANACTAQWLSGVGVLPCPGAEGDSKGFVLKQSNPKMENGVTSASAGLLTVPQAGTNTYIQGVYPAFRVESGDRFQATIGCEYGATACYVSFRLNYQVGSDPVQNFWSFNERYEGSVYNVNLDLTPLAGKDVKFILTVLSSGSASGDRAQWVAPRITRATAPASATFTTTATQIPATATQVPATATQIPATSTQIPATITATATQAPPTVTTTPTQAPATQTETFTPPPPTSTETPTQATPTETPTATSTP